MTPDFRYHVASLSAVFFALGIGIAIGTGFVGAKVVQQQSALMTRLNLNFAELRKETREREQTEEALRLLLPQLVKGRLRDRTVLVLQLGASNESAEKVSEALERSGATTLRLSLPQAAWLELSEVDRGRKAEALATALTAPLNGGLDELRSLGLVAGSLGEGVAIRRVVLAGGERLAAPPKPNSPESPLLVLARTRDVALSAALKKTRATVVAVEPFEAEPSLVRVWETGQASTIDCINRSAGQLTLPAVLLGEEGSFGMKPGADHLLPESLTHLPEPTPAPVPTP